jgi:hypothetical protein
MAATLLILWIMSSALAMASCTRAQGQLTTITGSVPAGLNAEGYAC